MEHTGSYYQCTSCNEIIDYSDSHCPNCGSQDETDLNAHEVKKIAEALIVKGHYYLELLKKHGDL